MSSGVFDAGAIVGALKLDTDPYAQGMLRAESIAKAFPDVLTTYLTNPLLAFGQVLKRTGDAVVSMFTDAAEHGDAMGELAASVGVGVESLTAFGAAAGLAGSSTEGVADSFRFLGKAVNEAMTNAESDASKTFRRLGVEFLTADGAARPLEDVLLDLGDAMAALPEGGARTSVAMSLLGRSGTELVPTLIQGSKALQQQMEQMKAYGVTVSSSAADTSGRWNDSMDEMKLAYHGLKQAFGEAVTPILLPYLEKLTDWTRDHQPQIRKAIEDAVKSVDERFKSLGKVFDFIGDHWRQMAAIAGGVGAYIAGPAVLGAIVKIGPALLALVSPIGAVRLAVLALQTALNPLGSMTRLFSLALAGVTAYVITQPGALKSLGVAWDYLAATAKYVGDVFSNVVAPAIGRAMADAFARLQPYLPTTADLMGLLGRAADFLQASFNGLVTFVAGTVIPAIGTGLAAAFEWIAPKLQYVGGVFRFLLGELQAVGAWVVGPGFDAIGVVFVTAWDYLRSAAEAVAGPIEAVGGVIASVVDWIVQTAVPAVGEAVSVLWGVVQPFLAALGGLVVMVARDYVGQTVSWLVGTAVPAVASAAVSLWGMLQPVFAGPGSIIAGVWDIAKGVTSWVVSVASVVFTGLGYVLSGLTTVFKALLDTFWWGWTNVLQPVVGWVWSALVPVLQTVGNVVGWLLDKVGNLLSWLGKVIDISGDAATAVNNVPVPAGAPTLQGPGVPPTSSGAGAFTPPPQPAPSSSSVAGDVAKQMADLVGKKVAEGVTSGAAAVKGLAVPNLNLPTLQMPRVELPSLAGLGRIGAGSGVEPLADRFADLRRGTAAVANEHAAAKNGESPDARQLRLDYNKMKREYDERITDARHNGASPAELDAIRREKSAKLRPLQQGIDGASTAARTGINPAGGPNINVNVPALDEKRLSDLTAAKVLEGQNRQLGQAVAASSAMRYRQDVGEGL